MSLVTLVNKPDFILYEIAPGKPDPKQRCEKIKDVRQRVLQSRLKGPTCWYYTMNFLRDRIGENPCEDLKQAREIERLCSQRRKNLTSFDAEFPIPLNELFSMEASNEYKNISKEKASGFLSNSRFIAKLESEAKTDKKALNVIPSIQEFISDERFNNMHEFLIWKYFSKWSKINKDFLKEVQDPTDNLITNTVLKNTDDSNTSLLKQSVYLDLLVIHKHIKLYGLHKSSWNLKQSFDDLTKELRDKGPLMVNGKYGKLAYEDHPYKLKFQEGGRDIYAWEPTAKRTDNKELKHSVLIVGAKKVKQTGYLYFIDCADESDPKDPSKQKIYVMSFKNLTDHIISLSYIAGSRDPEGKFLVYGNLKKA